MLYERSYRGPKSANRRTTLDADATFARKYAADLVEAGAAWFEGNLEDHRKWYAAVFGDRGSESRRATGQL